MKKLTLSTLWTWHSIGYGICPLTWKEHAFEFGFLIVCLWALNVSATLK